MKTSFDVVVVGGGHAGCEAAAAAARLGAEVALITLRPDRVGAMSCNPAIGGLGKGHLVREVDAFDGLIGRAADDAAIHYRMLNRSKGSAVRGPRVQADRKLFAGSIQRQLAVYQNLMLLAGEASALRLEGGRVAGVDLADGSLIRSGAVVIASGTFLGGVLHCGRAAEAGGRAGEGAATLLARQLREAGLPLSRLKTGTPPRLNGRTIDWSRLDRQESDVEPWTMSAWRDSRANPQLFCAVARTNQATHDIIAASLDQSPLHSGAIEGRGPRYCPSIEDKIARFGDRDGHQVFLEPEGLDDPLIYPNGISTSLPLEVQTRFLRTIIGLEHVDVAAAGYAVEYDFLDPRQLDATLESRRFAGLFFAGQVNGTTGYEEAAAQGLVAGLNAACHAAGRAPIRFDRSTSYIGVMVDDLTLQGVTEPYRMLTARAEFRLRLRADNALTRLAPQADAAGALRTEARAAVKRRSEARRWILHELEAPVRPEQLNAIGCDVAGSEARSFLDWLRFPRVDWSAATSILPALVTADPSIGTEIVEDARYAPYVTRQEGEVARMRSDALVSIPESLCFSSVAGLSLEMVERLEAARPATLSDAAHVPGLTPAALAALLIFCQRDAA